MIAVGTLVLVGGWVLGIRALETFSTALPTKANTAIAFILAGGSMLVAGRWPASVRARMLGRAAAAAAALIGSLTLIEYAAGRRLGIDELLFRDPGRAVGSASGGRMGASTAVCLTLVGSSLLLRDRGRWGGRAAQFGAGTVGVIAFASVLGHVYGVPRTETGFLTRQVAPMALQTALTLLVLVIALVASLPRTGLAALLVSRSGGGVMTRRLLPVAVLAPVVLGFARLKGQEAGLYGRLEGLVVFTTSVVVILAVVVTITAHVLEQAEGREAAEQDRAGQVREQLEARLRQAQKMEAIGNLAGGVAHDFNNLLLVIRGTSSLLLGRLAGSERDREYVRQIDLAAERAAELTRQLLAFSSRQALRPELTDLNAVVAETFELMKGLIGPNIELEQAAAKELPSILVDGGQLGQVILNLALNARDAMPDGGMLTTETGRVELDAHVAAEHGDIVPGSYVYLQMTDTGVGMDSETQDRVFDPFFTTKDGGTGLGLATAYGIVKQSGGDIWLASKPGFGTTFKLHFPVAAVAG